MSEAQFEDLLVRHPELVELIQDQTSVCGTDYLLKYRKLQHLHP